MQARMTDRQYLDAIQQGDIELVKKFLAENKDTSNINARTEKEKFPALSWAIANKQTAIALLIIQAGADVNLEAAKGVNPLLLAAGLGDVEVVNALLANPYIKVNKVNIKGLNSLETAALHGHAEVVKSLLNAGAAIQHPDFQRALKSKNQPEIITLITDYIAAKMNAFEIPESEISAADKEIIIKLSARNMARLKKAVTNLSVRGNLSSKTFSEALAKIAAKNPEVKYSKIIQSTDNPRMFNVSDMSFVLDPQVIGSGGQSTIYRGYASPDAAIPPLPSTCIKLFKGKDFAKEYDSALHEAQYLRMMGRRAELSRISEGPVIVTDWMHGLDPEALREKNDFTKIPLARRIKWLASGLADLNVLHDHFRLHGDIKVYNFIIDLNTDTMRLIDLGAGQKINSPKQKVASVDFIDPNEGKPKKIASDMYGMGKVVAYLFPDLYEYKKVKTTIMASEPHEPRRYGETEIMQCFKLKNDNLTPLESAIYQLVDAMMEATAENRCTSEQAMQFCIGLSQKMVNDQISAEELRELLNSTINRKEFTVEDALRDSSRPAFCAAKIDQTNVRIVASKVIEPPAVIVNPSPAKKHKTKKDKPAEEERKPHAKHAKSPATLFNTAPKKKAKANSTPTRSSTRKKR